MSDDYKESESTFVSVLKTALLESGFTNIHIEKVSLPDELKADITPDPYDGTYYVYLKIDTEQGTFYFFSCPAELVLMAFDLTGSGVHPDDVISPDLRTQFNQEYLLEWHGSTTPLIKLRLALEKAYSERFEHYPLNSDINWHKLRKLRGWKLPNVHWFWKLPAIRHFRWLYHSIYLAMWIRRWQGVLGCVLPQEYDLWRLYAIKRGWC